MGRVVLRTQVTACCPRDLVSLHGQVPCVCEMLWGAWRSSFSFLVDGLTACDWLFLEHPLILSIAVAMVQQSADWLRCQSHDPPLARVGQLGGLDLEKGSEGPCGDVR